MRVGQVVLVCFLSESERISTTFDIGNRFY